MHKKYIFSNIIGTFIFNEHFNPIDKKLFKNSEQYKNKAKIEEEFSKRYKNLKKPEGGDLCRVLVFFKKKEHFKAFYEGNLGLTKEAIKASVKDDLLVIQSISSIREMNKSINILIKRLREWYALYNPEFEENLQNQERFVELVIEGKESKVKDSMGADLSKEDLDYKVAGLGGFIRKHKAGILMAGAAITGATAMIASSSIKSFGTFI